MSNYLFTEHKGKWFGIYKVDSHLLDNGMFKCYKVLSILQDPRSTPGFKKSGIANMYLPHTPSGKEDVIDKERIKTCNTIIFTFLNGEIREFNSDEEALLYFELGYKYRVYEYWNRKKKV